MSEYYNRDGERITQLAWAASFDQDRQVASTLLGDVRVSTVWLGINHNWGDGPPLIFETMIFGLADDDEVCWRYPSEIEALRGHIKAIEFVFDSWPEPVDVQRAVESVKSMKLDLEETIDNKGPQYGEKVV